MLHKPECFWLQWSKTSSKGMFSKYLLAIDSGVSKTVNCDEAFYIILPGSSNPCKADLPPLTPPKEALFECSQPCSTLKLHVTSEPLLTYFFFL